jgi:hypothetical protein
MKDQADLMKRQADLMEAGFDQSTEFKSWKATLVKASKFLISVKLKNSTNFPMKITGEFQIQNFLGGQKERFLIGVDSFIPPKRHLVIEVRPGLTLEQQAVDSLSFRVHGYISHVHRISKRTLVQRFEYDLRCSQTPGTNDWSVQAIPLCQMNPEQRPEGPQGERAS